MSNDNKKIMIGVGVAVLVTTGVGAYFILQNNEKDTDNPLDDQLETRTSDKLFASTKNGVVTLFDSTNGKELDEFDLKSLSTGKEIIIEEKTIIKEDKPVDKKPEEVVTSEFEGFIRVPHIVVKGENSWKIQTALTPNRDTASMLKLVQKANNGRQLRLIHPGETLYYLQEKDGSSPEEVVKEVQTGEAIKEPTIEKVKIVKKVDENAVYLYSKSEDFKTLYAYNDIEESFYKISEKDKKISGELMVSVSDLKNVKDFKVIKNTLYVLYDNGNKVKEIQLDKKQKRKEFQLTNTAELFAVRNSSIFYTYKDQLAKIDVESSKETTILIGDNSIDYLFTEDNLYLLNSFGSKLDNSVLVKVNPSKMNVEDLVELKSNQNAILSESIDTSTIIVGQISKTKNVDNTILEKEVLLPIKPSNLKKEAYVKDVPFDKNALELDGYVYEVKDGSTSIYSATNGEFVNEIDINKATSIMPLK